MFNTAVAMTFAILLLPIGLMIDSLIGSFWSVSPWKLTVYGLQFIGGGMSDHYTTTLLLTIVLIIAATLLGIFFSKRNAATSKI